MKILSILQERSHLGIVYKHKAYQRNIVVSSDTTDTCQKPPTQKNF